MEDECDKAVRRARQMQLEALLSEVDLDAFELQLKIDQGMRRVDLVFLFLIVLMVAGFFVIALRFLPLPN